MFPNGGTGNGRATMSKARIMVVEDEAIVAMDLRAQLEDLGYAVSGSSNSGE